MSVCNCSTSGTVDQLWVGVTDSMRNGGTMRPTSRHDFAQGEGETSVCNCSTSETMDRLWVGVTDSTRNGSMLSPDGERHSVKAGWAHSIVCSGGRRGGGICAGSRLGISGTTL